MKIDTGCRNGHLYLSAYFRHLDMSKKFRDLAVKRTRQLAKVAKNINVNCAYLSCSECPMKMFFKHLENIDVYREENYPF